MAILDLKNSASVCFSTSVFCDVDILRHQNDKNDAVVVTVWTGFKWQWKVSCNKKVISSGIRSDTFKLVIQHITYFSNEMFESPKL